MGLQKKFVLSLSSLMMVASVAACSSNSITTAPGNIKGGADFSRVSSLSSPNVRVVSDEVAKDHIIIDVGNGKKTGATFSVKINLTGGDEFKVKSSSGTPAKTIAADLKSIKFWLIKSAGTPTGDISDVGVNFSVAAGAVAAINSSTGTQTATFTNVPDNTGGESYLVAAAAYNVPFTGVGAGTLDGLTNICNTTSGTAAPITFGASNGAFFSTAGGDTPTNAGKVKVSGFLLSPPTATTALGVTIKLRDGVGATITGSSSVTDGTYTGSITPAAS